MNINNETSRRGDPSLDMESTCVSHAAWILTLKARLYNIFRAPHLDCSWETVHLCGRVGILDSWIKEAQGILIQGLDHCSSFCVSEEVAAPLPLPNRRAHPSLPVVRVKEVSRHCQVSPEKHCASTEFMATTEKQGGQGLHGEGLCRQVCEGRGPLG